MSLCKRNCVHMRWQYSCFVFSGLWFHIYSFSSQAELNFSIDLLLEFEAQWRRRVRVWCLNCVKLLVHWYYPSYYTGEFIYWNDCVVCSAITVYSLHFITITQARKLWVWIVLRAFMSTFHHCMLVQIKIIDSGFAGLGEFQLFPVYQKEETRKNQSRFIPGEGAGGVGGGYFAAMYWDNPNFKRKSSKHENNSLFGPPKWNIRPVWDFQAKGDGKRSPSPSARP